MLLHWVRCFLDACSRSVPHCRKLLHLLAAFYFESVVPSDCLSLLITLAYYLQLTRFEDRAENLRDLSGRQFLFFGGFERAVEEPSAFFPIAEQGRLHQLLSLCFYVKLRFVVE